MPEGAITLSDILRRVGDVLKEEFTSQYWIMAEVLEMHVNRSGHCYLELAEKDAKNDQIVARTRATIWASRYSMLRSYFEASTGSGLKSGIKLLFRATVEFHTQYGFSLNITEIDPSYTLGDLARKKQEVIRRLTADGVIDMNRDLPFPLVPRRIAVISSETAAGYGDFMESVLYNSQGFRIETTLFQAVMQGDDAPASIIAALDRIFLQMSGFDCVAIIRGGGSRADLECYNSYDLAYFITQFPLPVITGIGHERDQSVADMVAARALKTPTAVAEFIIDQLLSFDFLLSALYERLDLLVNKIVRERTVRLDKLASGLTYLSRRYLDRKTEFLSRVLQQLPREIRLQLTRHSEHLSRIDQKLHRETRTIIARKKELLMHLGKRAELVHPDHILKRGYSITLHEGKAIRDTTGIQEGALLETRIYQGRITSTVEKIDNGNDKGKDQL